MGVGMPVLLVIADTVLKKCYFVCLNDYIDKILSPSSSDYRAQGSHYIYVPTLNCIEACGNGSVALRWYAKRPKLFAAFQRFYNQRNELIYSTGDRKMELANYLASRILQYDFWGDMNHWSSFKIHHDMLMSFVATGSHGMNNIENNAISEILGNLEEDDKLELMHYLASNEIDQLWDSLCGLSKNYENVWREKYLPTALGFILSYNNSQGASPAEEAIALNASPAYIASTDVEDNISQE